MAAGEQRAWAAPWHQAWRCCWCLCCHWGPLQTWLAVAQVFEEGADTMGLWAQALDHEPADVSYFSRSAYIVMHAWSW